MAKSGHPVRQPCVMGMIFIGGLWGIVGCKRAGQMSRRGSDLSPSSSLTRKRSLVQIQYGPPARHACAYADGGRQICALCQGPRGGKGMNKQVR
jgi:hypothetical protein